MVDVFISYSRSDLAAVTQLAQAVEAEGYEVWWDADLPPHLSYGDVITAKIGMAKAAIVVWSKESAASEWVRAEADMARNQKKLVQTALDNVMPPLPFNQIQYAEIGDWHGEPDHPAWRKVKVSLAELCGRNASPETRTQQRQSPDRTPIAPPAAAASKWPLYAGVGFGAIALALAAWIAFGNREDGEAPVPSPTVVAATKTAAPVPSPAPQGAAAVDQSAVVPAPAPEPAVVAPIAAEPAIASTEGMIFADSSRRRLRPAEIAGLGPATLAIARNEIYARRGRRFARVELKDYFSQFDWYRPVADEVRLNAVERDNVALLRRAEARFGQ